mmetsp:Transcript_14057/g.27016  ORF Transcript_14057/g.27016 Transcript_14057/m.27016 type:complete len:400 (+) Transcript_14057:329-1528(+)
MIEVGERCYAHNPLAYYGKNGKLVQLNVVSQGHHYCLHLVALTASPVLTLTPVSKMRVVVKVVRVHGAVYLAPVPGRFGGSEIRGTAVVRARERLEVPKLQGPGNPSSHVPEGGLLRVLQVLAVGVVGWPVPVVVVAPSVHVVLVADLQGPDALASVAHGGRHNVAGLDPPHGYQQLAHLGVPAKLLQALGEAELAEEVVVVGAQVGGGGDAHLPPARRQKRVPGDLQHLARLEVGGSSVGLDEGHHGHSQRLGDVPKGVSLLHHHGLVAAPQDARLPLRALPPGPRRRVGVQVLGVRGQALQRAVQQQRDADHVALVDSVVLEMVEAVQLVRARPVASTNGPQGVPWLHHSVAARHLEVATSLQSHVMVQAQRIHSHYVIPFNTECTRESIQGVTLSD